MLGGRFRLGRATLAITAALLLAVGGVGLTVTEGRASGPPSASSGGPGTVASLEPSLAAANATPALLREISALDALPANCLFACFHLPSLIDGVLAVLAGVVVGSLCLGAGAVVAEGGGSIAVGCVLLAIAVAGALYAYFTVEANQGTVTEPDLYGPAEAEASALLGSLGDQSNDVGGTLANIAELTDSLTGLYGFEAAAASGTQLPNDSFSLAQDLVQSGVASQMLSEADGAAINLAGPLEGFQTSWNDCFGTTGACGVNDNYGGDGYVCSEASNVSLYVTSEGTYPNPYLQGFTSGPNPDVSPGPDPYEDESGSWGSDGGCREDVSVDNPHVATNSTDGYSITDAGVLLPTPTVDTGAYPVYVGADSSLLFGDWASEDGEWTDACGYAGLFNFTGPYPSLDQHHFNVTESGIVATGLPAGLYYANTSAVVPLNLSHDSCSLAFEGESYWLGDGILPLILGDNETDDELAKATGLAATASGQLLFACQSAETQVAADQATSPYSGVVPVIDWPSATADLPPVSVCSDGSPGFLPALEEEMIGASDFGEGEWSALHDLGVYQESIIPPNCVPVTPADFLPPDTPLNQIIAYGPHDIASLILAYMTVLSNSYGDSEPDYCGFHVPPPGNVTLNDPNWALIGDVYTHSGDQSFDTPSSWFVTGDGLDVLPDDGNYTIPVNETYEVSSANPAVVYYGPTDPAVADLTSENVSNATIDLTYGGVIPNLNGNSTLRNGSVYPADTDSRLGTGDALYLTECWHNSSGTWKTVATCDLNVNVVSYVQPNGSGSCYFEGSCNGSGGGFPQPQGINCGFFLATDFATPFENSTVFGFSLASFACVIGWLFVVLIFGVVVVVVVAIIRHVSGGGGG
jgi:hypothetical protein